MVTIPSGSESEITFISGVDSSFQVASKAYWGWNRDAPATYNATQTNASKWGSTTLQASGPPGKHHLLLRYAEQQQLDSGRAERPALGTAPVGGGSEHHLYGRFVPAERQHR